VATKGPRSTGSAAPQRSFALLPARGGCDVSTIARGGEFLAGDGKDGVTREPDIDPELRRFPSR
jgi:hypothetical protein